jgi:hypothetical protein
MKPRAVGLVVAALSLVGCTSIGVGLSIPIGGLGGVSIGVGSDGRVSGGVSVGGGGVSVGVGGSTQLPPPQDPAVRSRAAAPAASAASAAANAASAASTASSPNT